MAQLSDDCFAFGGALLTVADALSEIEARVAPVVETETVPLTAAAGRILARDVIATMNLPPHDNSAVDGYAVAHADLIPDRDTVMPVTGRAAAGHPLDRPARRGEAIRIFTGAPMPDGADTVMMQEDCAFEDGRVLLRPGIRRGANRRHAGEDVTAGEVALPAGRRLRAPDLGLAAALGRHELLRFSPLAGGAAVDRGRGSRPGCTAYRRAPSMTPTASCSQHCCAGLGCAVSDFGIRPDREAALVDTLAAASARARSDRHLGRRLDRRGGSCQVRRRDGSALSIFGGSRSSRDDRSRSARSSGVPLIGLPGNPVAAIVTFLVLARPLICEARWRDGPRAVGSFRSTPVSAIARSRGGANICAQACSATAMPLVAVKYARDGAGILSSIVRSDGLVILDEASSELTVGTTVDFLPFSEVIG